MSHPRAPRTQPSHLRGITMREHVHKRKNAEHIMHELSMCHGRVERARASAGLYVFICDGWM